MDFTAPTEADVDMAMHDDGMLDVNLAAQFGNPRQHPHAHAQQQHMAIGGGMVEPPQGFGFVPGLNPIDPHGLNAQQQPQSQQGFHSVEEYAALMGIKLEIPNEDPAAALPPHMQGPPGVNSYNVQPGADLAKIQANAAYFENLYREQRIGSELNGGNGGNVTSMTLPAGLGSGMNSANLFVGGGAGPAGNPMYDRTSELAFNDMNRLYDPSSGYSGAPLPMHKPVTAGARMMNSHELGSQTLSAEILSAMSKNNPQHAHNFDNLNEEEKAALLKEEKSRERNRDHSRKSRLRKKEFVESLKHQVQQLEIYQQICEQCLDLISLVTSEASAIFLYSSASYSRVLGYQGHQLVPGQTSFLDLVHPDNVQEVRSIFQKFNTLGETRKFQFRIKSVEGEYFPAETCARMAEKGVVCSTRVDRAV